MQKKCVELFKPLENQAGFFGGRREIFRYMGRVVMFMILKAHVSPNTWGLGFVGPPLLFSPLFSLGPSLSFGLAAHALLNLNDASSTFSQVQDFLEGNFVLLVWSLGPDCSSSIRPFHVAHSPADWSPGTPDSPAGGCSDQRDPSPCPQRGSPSVSLPSSVSYQWARPSKPSRQGLKGKVQELFLFLAIFRIWMVQKYFTAEEFCKSLDRDFMRSGHSELEAQMVIYESHSGEMEESCSLWTQTR